MSAALFFPIVGIFAAFLVLWMMANLLGDRLTISEKRELKQLTRTVRKQERLISEIDRLAYQNRELDPELSVIIIDEISKYRDEKHREIE